jgi:outer membrane protein assembly factor BamD
LAEAQFRIAYYYYVKGDKRAAAGRLVPLVNRYPLYSKTDEALWMLGDIFEKSERKDIAGGYYAAIVKNYPLSRYDADAKAKLVALGVPVPQPDPKAVAWMTAEQNTPRPKESMVHRGVGMFHSGPDIDTAAHNGMPQMEPEAESASAVDILSGKNATGLGPGKGTSSIVGTVSPGQSAPAAATAGSAEDVNTGSSPTETTAPVSTDGTTAPATTPPPAGGDATPAPAAAAPAADGTAATDSAKTDGTTAAAPATDGTTPATDTTNTKESSSKKKGLKKLIPW